VTTSAEPSRLFAPLAASCVALWTAALAGGAQAPVDLRSQTFRAGVTTVPVTVTVVDAQRRLIRGLTREDFSVFEDGVEQPVTQFTDQRVPVSLGLLLDASDSMRGRPIADARVAVEHFVGDLLWADDEAFIALFNHRPRLAAPWTQPASSLRTSLGRLDAGGGTAIYDAIVQAAPFFDRRARPRAALVVISDGADTASDRTLQQARTAVVRRDAFVYALAIDEPGAPASTRVSPGALRDLTEPTGGYTEVVHDAADLGPATARIAEELNSQYTLGFDPAKKPDGTFRAIRVRVKRDGLFVRSRRGYVAEGPASGR
jgi:Ca-activated chloride channel family protein